MRDLFCPRAQRRTDLWQSQRPVRHCARGQELMNYYFYNMFLITLRSILEHMKRAFGFAISPNATVLRAKRNVLPSNHEKLVLLHVLNYI